MDSLLSVSEFSEKLKNTVEKNYCFVSLQGEISDIHESWSGHTYFQISDENASIRCVIFKYQKKNISYSLKKGHDFIIWGKVNYYEKRGEVSIIVNLVLPSGEGSEALKLKLLKEKLKKEGLFSSEHKKKIPEIVEHIGVVTSEGGAAVHDIVRVARTRFPSVKITLYPVPVQGESASKKIVKALKFLDEKEEIDVIVVGRGGGSSLDLSVFNNENLARAIVSAEKPVVSAVGHETDTTVADLCSSLSVSTPSAAAERIVKKASEISSDVDYLVDSMEQNIIQKIRNMNITLDRLMFIMSGPESWIEKKKHRLSYLVSEISQLANKHLQEYQRDFSDLYIKFIPLNPKLPLKHGYTLIHQNNSVVRTKKRFRKDSAFSIEFKDGTVSFKNKKS
ncbi:MAG: exodeoxyribonuclease VII large subunit [bacterium]